MTATFVTFYSFKGGVGRTQALANTAVSLANRGRRVIIVDMDLESPGLHSFFDAAHGGLVMPQAGVLEFLEHAFQLPETAPQATSALLACTHARHMPSSGSIRILGAGGLGRDYEKRLSSFSWDLFYRERDGYRFMELFRQQLGEADADFVLVDSRTGLNDTGHICTFQLPDVIVALFALHSQGIDGTRRLAEAVRRCQQAEGEQGRPRRLLLVPARVDEAAPEALRERWLAEARRAFDGTHELLADFHERIPYAAQIAFGEQIAVGGAQSMLSEAYERLVDRIVGLPDEDVIAPLHEIRGWLHELAQELRHTSSERQPPNVQSLRDLRRWLAAESDRREAILGRIDRSRRALDRLRSVGGPDAIVVGPTTRLDTDEEVRMEASHLAAVVQLLDRWVDVQQEHVRAQLVAAAEGDEHAAAASIAALYESVRAGRRMEVEKQVSDLKEMLGRENVPALLRQGRLTIERLRRSHPSPGQRGVWVEQMLDSTISAPSATDTRLALKNLLSLARADGTPPTLLQWMAYELICGDPVEDQFFSDIGAAMWRAEWSRLLAEPTGSHVDMDYPVGIDGRNQIERLAQGSPAELRTIAVDIRDGIIALWRAEPRGREHLVDLFRRRNPDPLLREGIHLIAMDPAPPALRSGILATWLEACDRPEAERHAARGLLVALVENGYVGEAFYALSELTRHNPDLGSDPGFAFVWTALLCTATMRRSEAWCRRLVTSPEAISAVLSHRVGRALLVALAAGWTAAPADVAVTARTKLLHGDASSEPIPARTHEWLLTLERDQQVDRALVARVATARHEIEAIGSKTVYSAWAGSAAWVDEFRALTQRELTKVLEARSAEAAAKDVDSLEVATWVSRTYERLRRSHVKTNSPDGTALKAIERNFSELRRALGALAELVPHNGRSLLDETRGSQLEGHARKDLVTWLSSSPSPNDEPVEIRLSSGLREQLEERRS
jgi:MinD-like ATPase involved in chromosome partitioning or flagellar assembly